MLYVFRGQANINGELCWTYMIGTNPNGYEIPTIVGNTKAEAMLLAIKECSNTNQKEFTILRDNGTIQDLVKLSPTTKERMK